MLVIEGWGPTIYRRSNNLEKTLYKAVYRNDVESVKKILDKGANASHFNVDYEINNVTPLFLAVMRSNLANVKMLIDVEANIFTTSLTGKTLLHIAASRILDTPYVCEFLLDKMKAKVSNEEYLELINSTDDKGNTALDYAMRLGRPKISEILKREGAYQSISAARE